jgi:uncharacterized protein (DUF3084 family)
MEMFKGREGAQRAGCECEELAIERLRLSQERQWLAGEREQLIGGVEELWRWRRSDRSRGNGPEGRGVVGRSAPICADLDRWLQRRSAALMRREQVVDERARIADRRARLAAARRRLATGAEDCSDLELAPAANTVAATWETV